MDLSLNPSLFFQRWNDTLPAAVAISPLHSENMPSWISYARLQVYIDICYNNSSGFFTTDRSNLLCHDMAHKIAHLHLFL